MIGLFESGFSPIIIFLLGTWYTKTELAKRIAIWHITGFFGSATSGFLQAGIYSSLNGRLGLAGWRWMYIICGCMSLPVAFSVWWLLPDYPHNTKAWYLTEEDKKLAIERGAREKKAEVTGVLDFKLVKRMFGSWRWWVLVLMYIFVSLGPAPKICSVLLDCNANLVTSMATLAKLTATLLSISVSHLRIVGDFPKIFRIGSLCLNIWCSMVY